MGIIHNKINKSIEIYKKSIGKLKYYRFLLRITEIALGNRRENLGSPGV
jgi:hypothetical protein